MIYNTGKEPPSLNNAEPLDNGAHFALRCSDEVHRQIADFLAEGREGTITLHCGGGACFIEGVDCRTDLGD